MPHPLIYSAPYRLGPSARVNDELFRRLCRSRDYLAARINEPQRLAGAARQACLSPYYYHRVFRRTFGETPLEFVTRLRIDRAKELLIRRQLSVTDTCLEVGYESLGSFSTRFRTLVGYSPSEFQQAVRQVFATPKVAPYRFVPSCFVHLRRAFPLTVPRPEKQQDPRSAAAAIVPSWCRRRKK